MKNIVLTGGGTAGHVTPNMALISRLKEKGYNINYIGSKTGIEKELIENIKINYYGISSGKLRRYFSLKNFTDVINVLKGIKEASYILKKLKPDIIFSKGGFVTVPVVISAHFNKIPIIIHESDMTPGLANKIALPFSTKICVSFPETMNYVNKNKAVLTGSPIRSELFKGNKENGFKICNFKNTNPVLLIMGGSLGSVKINECIRKSLNKLINKYQIIHICGKGNLDKNLNNIAQYKQFEYLSNELSDIFAISDIVISRAGSNSIYEFLALKKPTLLIPLSKNASRGDQILNAQSFEKQGFSKVLFEENLTEENLINSIENLYSERKKYIDKMNNTNLNNGVTEIIKLIENLTNKN